MNYLKLFLIFAVIGYFQISSNRPTNYKLIRISTLCDNNWFVFKDSIGNLYQVFAEIEYCKPCDTLKVGMTYSLCLEKVSYITNNKGVSSRLDKGLYDVSKDTILIESGEPLFTSKDIIGICYNN